MTTPKNAPYKLAQRAAEASKYKVRVLWISCQISESTRLDSKGNIVLMPVRQAVQGTRRTGPPQRTRGKAAIKAAKRLTHTKGFYLFSREVKAA